MEGWELVPRIAFTGVPNLRLGDCIEVMRTLDADSVDAVVCDPPYGLKFMGKDWDSLGGRTRPCKPRSGQYENSSDQDAQAWHYAWAVEALRVLKPGGFLLAFGGDRTIHRMICAIEDAGFECRGQIAWIYGSGFPKSLDVSKAIDREAGAERDVVGYEANRARPNRKYEAGALGNIGGSGHVSDRTDNGATITAPATPEAARWQGWGTALKPAMELICMARKPLSESNVAANVLKHGTGAFNIAACRIGYVNDDDKASAIPQGKATAKVGALAGGQQNDNDRAEFKADNTKGRWPANVVHDGSDEVLVGFPDRKTTWVSKNHANNRGGEFLGKLGHPGDQGFNDAGSVSRFFYTSKAASSERWCYCRVCKTADKESVCHNQHAMHCHDCGVDYQREPVAASGTERLNQNNQRAGYRPGSYSKEEKHKSHRTEPNIASHPTVKPVDLMEYLCRLVTRPGGTILDPFMGSGSTGVAAHNGEWHFIGIERDPEYFEIAKQRIEGSQSGHQSGLF